MCTVSFVPGKSGIWLSSNRDEKCVRPIAIPPEVHQINSVNVLFPRDTGALGTWIATQENGTSAVLLNGAFEPHQPLPRYRISRGQVLLQLISRSSTCNSIRQFDLNDVEPFTLVVWEEQQLMEFRWNGNQLFSQKLNSQQAHIWSSVTLYSPRTTAMREEWFQQFLASTPEPDLESLLNFHQMAGNGDTHQSLMMRRQDEYATVSITNLECQPHQSVMTYLDTISQKRSSQRLSYKNVLTKE